MTALLLALALAASGYTPNVERAREWARQHTSPHGFRCLHILWERESRWSVHGRGPLTRWGRAYGIPQALPGRKMRSAGPDWRTNATTQVRWGLRYVRARYGTPCRARAYQRARGWY